MALALRTVQNIHDRLRREPITVLQPASMNAARNLLAAARAEVRQTGEAV
jgi:hypothetical protein